MAIYTTDCPPSSCPGSPQGTTAKKRSTAHSSDHKLEKLGMFFGEWFHGTGKKTPGDRYRYGTGTGTGIEFSTDVATP